MTSERGATENHWNGDAETIHLVQVFFHHSHRLHQQSAHANRVGLGVAPCVENRVQRLFDADVVNLESVVGENDVDEILADVMHIARHRGQHNARLLRGALVGLGHVRLENGYRFLHDCGRLQHKRQLHLTRTKEFAHGLHATEQMIIDDRQRRIGLERDHEVLLEVA